MDLALAVQLVALDRLQMDGIDTVADAIAHAFDTLRLPEEPPVPGAYPIEEDGTELATAYRTVLEYPEYPVEEIVDAAGQAFIAQHDKGHSTTKTIAIQVPVLINGLNVHILLVDTPSDDLHWALTRLKFYVSGYTDVRTGPSTALDEAVRLTDAAGNRLWKFTFDFDQRTDAVIGDVLTHARLFYPEATAASLVGGVLVKGGTNFHNINGRWVAWGTAQVKVSA